MAAGSTQTSSLPWDETQIPEVGGTNDKDLNAFLSCSDEEHWRPEESGGQTWDNAPNRTCYSSFGEDGITATVSAYGNLMQFGRYIGKGRSGVFTADQGCVPEPYLVKERTAELLAISDKESYDQPDMYGFRFTNLSSQSRPKLSYVNYRWPRFCSNYKDIKGNKVDYTTLWLVHHETVVQHCILQNQGQVSVPVSCEFSNQRKSILIRDMDHLDPGYIFNDVYSGYTQTNGPKDLSWVLMHQLEPPNDNYSDDMTKSPTPTRADSVAIIISIFVDGRPLHWEKSKPNMWVKTLAPKSKDESTMEIAIAYRMILLEGSMGAWQSFLIPAIVSDVYKSLRKEPQPGKLSICNPKSPDPNETQYHGERRRLHRNGLEYIARRNLEHILSVCAIPLVRPQDHWSSKGIKLDDPGNKFSQLGRPIALTCGDISFHRVTSSGSFFAFQFLVEVANLISRSEFSKTECAIWLLGRIWSTCRGHVAWILCQAERRPSGYFAANYWVPGKIMHQDLNSSWQPLDSLTDTAYQLIKIQAYITSFGKDKTEAGAILNDPRLYLAAFSWLSDMHVLNRRGSFAWPHAQEDGTGVFRLDDHVWIWRAIKAIEEWDLMTSSLWVSKNLLELPPHLLGRKFASRDVQREVFRRFTTENDFSRRRTLAVFRSSRETRFLFHSRDTVLFYGLNWGFFPEDPSSQEVWENTLEAQALHDENQETRWDNALRYALGVIMGTLGHSINKRSPANLVEASLDVLFKSSSQNGLFFGQLDETTKEPILFHMDAHRDFYYHASFEIPYILLVNSSGITNPRSLPEKAKLSLEPDSNDSLQILPIPKRQLTGIERGNTTRPLAAQREQYRKATSMKKIVPFNYMIDSFNIVEIDEEWLYNYPSFLPSHNSMVSSVEGNALEKTLRQVLGDLLENPIFISPFTEALLGRQNAKETIMPMLDNYGQVRWQLCNSIIREPLLLAEMITENKNLRKAFNRRMDTDTVEGVNQILDPAGGINGQEDWTARIELSTFLLQRDIYGRVTEFFQEFLGRRNRILLEDSVELESIRLELDWILRNHMSPRVQLLMEDQILYSGWMDLCKLGGAFSGHVIAESIREWLGAAIYRYNELESGQHTENLRPIFDQTRRVASVSDTRQKVSQGKKKPRYGGDDPNPIKDDGYWEMSRMSNDSLFQRLSRFRTPAEAKKRFIWLPKPNAETALVCYLGTPGDERTAISSFFDRHAHHDLYFFDDTTRFLNTWETEIHLTFYQLVDSRNESELRSPSILRRGKDDLPGSKASRITRASMGFRFHGDLFDRYWTCHFIECTLTSSESERSELSSHYSFKERTWRQRKVLELYLFDRILTKLVSSTTDIIEKLKNELGVREGAFSFVDLKSDDYFSSSDRWQEAQQTLQAIENHLEQVEALVSRWESREDDRGSEKPRWTRNDERKYRGDIKKLLGSNNNKIKNLRSLRIETGSLRELLGARQEQISSDLSLRGAEDIRFFTYVTVVFLPLGFAASIFSMSGTPEGSLIGNMAACALVALVLTVFALVNAETLGAKFAKLSSRIEQFSERHMEKSSLFGLHKKGPKDDDQKPIDKYHKGNDQKAEKGEAGIDSSQKNQKKTEPSTPGLFSSPEGPSKVAGKRSGKNEDLPPSHRRVGPSRKKSWHAWFWLRYFLIEFPARRVASAYRDMRSRRFTWMTGLNGIGGIILLPWCIIVFLAQIVGANLVDLSRTLWLSARFLYQKYSQKEDPFEGQMRLLLKPDHHVRPLKSVNKEIEKKIDDLRR
ncbi:uncharacterized protein JN550_012312 [Neoarthrinium moseri]|uniref:uncharacterized protein n=1 Tax=Neoarthrinium moseri TaxID=1658444 RepID=UPI001FDE15EB|nr:uncharacterized protein JN550_012312 [Neoarthrinium moseri]KAI1858954.1 hypothetical protein JN550_012312 [Neoarthrinium moseri]